MAVRPGLIAALALAVLLAHLAAIDWLAARWQPPVFKQLAKPMYTRQITQQVPSANKYEQNMRSPPVQSTRPAITSIAKQAPGNSPKKRAKKPEASASPEAATQERATPESSRTDDKRPTAAAADKAADTDATSAAAAPLPQAEPPTSEPGRQSEDEDEDSERTDPNKSASAPSTASTAPNAHQTAERTTGAAARQAAERPIEEAAGEGVELSAEPATQTPRQDDPLPGWPNDTRLTYDLTGNYNGELHGSAQVLWQHQGNDYEAMIEIDLGLLLNLKLKSQGRITPQGLAPRAYEELQRTRRRQVRLEEGVVVLNDGKRVNRPPEVQDTASQFVELAHRFATGQAPLAAGQTITLSLARPGAVDSWTYDVVGKVLLPTPRLGAVEAYHLKPRPLVRPGGNISAEIWFAPSLQYLPVKIRVSMNENTWVDLVVKRIDQR